MRRGVMTIDHSNGDIIVTIDRENGNVWHTTSEIADMFMINRASVVANIKRIFNDDELLENDVVRCDNGVTYYNLDMIIALAFRCKGAVCRKFREWLRHQALRPVANAQPLIIHLGNGTYLS
ncbi:MAG: hypothetical protein SNH27_18000 [Rikenellaceae bacterium]